MKESVAAIIYVVLFFVAGTISAFIFKGVTIERSDYTYFEHAYFMTFLMFLGEYLSLPLSKLTNNKELLSSEESAKKKAHPFIFAIPAFFDLAASTIISYAIIFVSVSVSQMMSSIMMICVCAMSAIFLKKKYFRHHITALAIILVGVTLVAMVSVVYSGGDKTPTSPVGVIMYIIAMMFQATQIIIEEYIFNHYQSVHPMQLVGYEGLSGVCYYLIILPILQFVPCTPIYLDSMHHAYCAYGKQENTVSALSQMAGNKTLLILLIIYPLTLMCMNIAGQGITKHLSALSRTIINQCRTIVVWGISLILGWESFYILQFIGFILLICGALFYNEIIVLKCCGFDQNTRKAIAARKAKEATTES
jgi:UAA transporter family